MGKIRKPISSASGIPGRPVVTKAAQHAAQETRLLRSQLWDSFPGR